MDEVLAWAVEVSTGQELCCSVLETEGHLIEALTGAGFERVDGGPFFTHHTMSLTELDDPVLEEGFTLRYVEQRGPTNVRHVIGRRGPTSVHGSRHGAMGRS